VQHLICDETEFVSTSACVFVQFEMYKLKSEMETVSEAVYNTVHKVLLTKFVFLQVRVYGSKYRLNSEMGPV